MNDQAQVLARYHRLRLVGKEVHGQLTERLTRDILDDGATKLGILHGRTRAVESHDELSLLTDFCVHDIRRGGLTMVERFLAENPYPPGSDKAIWLEALRDAHFSLFLVEGVERGFGVQVRDLVRDEGHFVVDVSFSETAPLDLLIAFRLIAPEDIAMTTGVALPVGIAPSHCREEAIQQAAALAQGFLGSTWHPEQKSEATAVLLRHLREAGAASRISYTEPGAGPGLFDEPRPARKAATVGPYDPCPCGSGKKFKFCCRGKR